MAREVDSREIDETALHIDRDVPHANLVAHIGPLKPADDAPLDGHGEQSSPDARGGCSGHEGVKRGGRTAGKSHSKNGRRYEESSGSEKESDAKSLLRFREGDIERGVAIAPAVGRIRLDEAVKDVIDGYRTNRKRSLDDVERRIEPMARELRELLEQQRAMTENLQRQLKVVCPRVFHRAGRAIKSFRVAFRSACEDAGCPGRSCTTSAEPPSAVSSAPASRSGVAMQMSGHKTRSVFERYNIVGVGDLREAARRLDIATGTVSGTIEKNRRSGSKV